MRIYFAGSIRGGRDDRELYGKLIRHIGRFGVVLTEHVGDGNLPPTGEEGLTDREIYQRDLNWIREADVVVAEVTVPSLGVGYEIATAEELGKPILCLFREGEERVLSAMVSGSDRVTIACYKKPEEALSVVDRFFDSLRKK